MLIYAILLLVSSVLGLILYIPIVLIFLFDKEFRGNTAYTIMLWLGVLDIFQLFVHLYSGVLVAIGDEQVDFYVNKVVGALFTGLWYAMLATIMFLTYNRFDIMVLEKFDFFSGTFFRVVWMLVCLSNLVVPIGLKLLPGCNYLFNSTTMKWVHPPDDIPLSNTMDAYGEYLLWTVVIFSISGYLGIYLYMTAVHGRSAFRGKEWQITLQFSLIVGYFLFAIFYWYYFTSFFTINPMLFNFLSEIIWILLNGLNPFVYLVFNKRLRNSFLLLLKTCSLRRDRVNSITIIRKERSSHD